ncbi:hypothetical protein OROHE_004192 [Orobanche hederae]
MPSQEILKIRDGTPLEAEEILTYIKRPSKRLVCYFSSKLYVPSNVVHRKRVARILFFKIRPSQEILKIPDGTPLEAEEILTYIKRPSKRLVCYFSSKLYVPSNVVHRKRVARILFFKIRPSQEILKIRDGIPFEAEEILTYIKSPRNGSVCYFSSKLDIPCNVVQKKRVARILFFKIRPSQEILKIRDGTPLEAEEILTYIKSPRNGSVCYFSSKLDVPSNVVQKKRVARILFFKIRPSQEILKIRDGTPLEAEEILTYIKKSSKRIEQSQEILKIRDGTPLVQKKRVARILFFKIRPSQEILKIRDGTPLEAEEILTYIKKPSKRIGLYFSSKLDVPSNLVQKKRVAQILFFKIRPSQEILKIRDGTPLEPEEILTNIKKPSKRIEILKIRDGTPLEAEEILTYIKRPSQEILKIPDGTPLEKKRVARILFFKIRPSQEILKIRDGIPFEAEEILTYIKSPRNGSVCYFSSKLDIPCNVVQKKRVARILFFKIRPSQEILKIRDGTPLEAEEILTYIKSPRNGSVCYFSSKLDVPSNVVQKKKVARILLFKIRPSQEILKIRDGTPLEAEEILTYIKKPSKRICLPSQEILKIRDGTPLEAEEILTYIKRPSKRLVCYFSSKLYVPSNVVHRKRVARILFFKIRPSQEILKIPDGTPLEAEEIQKKRVARILFFKIRPSQEILKIRDGIPFEAEEILTYIKSPRNGSVCYFSSKLDIPCNVVQKKRVARILFFKIRPSQEILKIRDGTPLEAEEILTYIKSPRNGSVCYFSSKLDVPSNVVQKKRVARILFFKIRPSQEILKIRDGTPLEAEEILTYIKKSSKRIEPSQEILKIRDGIPLEAEEILTYIKRPSKRLVCYFSSKLYVPSNVVHRKRVARILFFKIRPSQEILKIPDGTPLEAEEILTYLKKPSQEILKIRDGTPLEAEEILTYIKRPSQEILKIPDVQKKRVARILFFKIRPSQEILKIRDGIPFEAEEILTYIKSPRNGSVCYFSSKLDIPCNVVQKKRVARILFFKIRPSQEILKIRDGTPLEAEEILTYIKSPRNGSVCYFSSKLDVPSNVVQKKRVARILYFKIRPSQEILKIRDGTPLEAEEILTYIKKSSKRIGLPSQEILKIRDGTPLEAEEILTYIKKPSKRIEILKIRDGTPLEPSQEILKIRDGIPLEAEEILTYIKSPRNGSVCYFSSKLDITCNVVQKKRVARILFFKIRPSQEILKIRDGTPLEAEEILTYIKKPSKRIEPSQEILKIRDGTPLEAEEILTYIKRPSQEILKIPDGTPLEKKRVARILFFKIRPSQEILKIRDGIPFEAEEILTYIKSPRNGSVCYFSSKLDIPCNVVQKKRVARILFFKIRPSQEILKIRDGTPLEAEEILTYIKSPRNGSVCYFSSKLDVPSNVVQKKRVARILFFKIRPSQEILKIRDGTPLEAEEILTYIKKSSKRIEPSQEILKIRDGIPLEAEEILTYIKRPSKRLVCYFSSKLYVPSNVVHRKRVARILFFKIRPSQEILKIPDGTPLEAEEILTYLKKPSQEILKIRDGTPLEAEEILTYIKRPSKRLVCYFSSKLYVPSNVVHRKRVARILFFKIRPSQEILKIPDGTPLEAEEIQKKRVARILFFKIRPSQEILKIRDGIPFEAEEILTYIKSPRNGSVCYFSSKLDIPCNVVQKKRVARILFFKIRPSQEILKIRDGTPLEAEEILTYIKSPRNGSVCYFSSKLDVPSNVVQKKRVARILYFKIRPSQEILKIRDGTPLEAEEILTYIKKSSKRIEILKIRDEPSQEILKIRDGIPLEAEEILTYIKSPRNGSVCYFSSKLDITCNVVQKKRVARILFFKIRPSQEILKIRDGTPLEAEEILTYIKKPSKRIEPSQEILKIRDGTPLEAEEILTYIKRPSQEILKIPDVQKKRVARILFFKIRPSQEILKIRDGIPFEAEEILTYIKSPRNGSVCYFSSKLDIPCNVVQKKRVARILFFKIRPSQEILKIRDGTPLEAEEILTYIKSPRNGSVCYFSSKLDVPSNVVQKKRVARILFFKIRPSQEILKIRDGTPSEAEEILTYIKKSSKRIVQKKRVARILFFKIRPSQEILKIRDGIPLEAEEILTYIKSPRNGSVCYFSSKLDITCNVVQKKRVARILFFKIRPSQEILKIRDGTPLEAEEILTYIKSPRNGSVCYFSSKLDVPSNVVQKKKVARILLFKIRPSQEILKIRDGTPLEAEEILTYIKKPSKRICLLLF